MLRAHVHLRLAATRSVNFWRSCTALTGMSDALGCGRDVLAAGMSVEAVSKRHRFGLHVIERIKKEMAT